jgi:hypothetical protein
MAGYEHDFYKLLLYKHRTTQDDEKKVFQLLESYGVKSDPHPQMFKYLRDSNLRIVEANGIM